MMLHNSVKYIILHATAKALATYGSAGINVVPVSSIQVVDDTIWLIDYFMEKTRQQILENSAVSLVCRKDMLWYQIKAQATYLQTGVEYEIARDRATSLHPDRTVKGLIILEPDAIYDIAPAKNTHAIVSTSS